MPGDAVAALRRARRRRRVSGIDGFEAFYRIYLFGLGLSAASYFAAGAGGLVPPGPAAIAAVSRFGPGVAGTAISALFGLGLASGARGGPLVLERADIHHLLLAPVDRRVALAGPARALLRRYSFFGALVGALCGMAALRRLPGFPLEWLAVPGAVGALVGVGSGGAAMLAAGRRLGPARAGSVALVLVGWSLADALAGQVSSPGSLLAAVALWPLPGARFSALDFVGVATAAGAAISGLAVVGRTDVEALARRSGLVGALRYAAAARDLRSVAMLRRQLSFERPRPTPYLRRRPGAGAAGAVAGRDLAGALRWPLRRLARMAVLGSIAGVSLRAAWQLALPFSVLAAVAMWLVALDAAEGLGQELDHPTLVELVPRPAGWIYLRHLVVPLGATALAGAIGVLVAAAPGNWELVAVLGAVGLLPAAACAVAAAAVSIVRPLQVDPLRLGISEVAGAYVLIREMLPPALAFSGLLPVLGAAHAAAHGASALQSEIDTGSFVLLVPIATLGWLQAKGRVEGSGAGG